MVSSPSELPGSEDDGTLTGLNSSAQLPTLVAIPRLRFVVEREAGKATGRTVDVEGERIRVGSHPSNELVLSDRRVSRFHCVLSLEGGAWRVTDSGALNGTMLRGVRVRDAFLPPDDCELVLGDSTLRIAQLRPEKVRFVPDLARFGELHGSGIAMREVFSLLDRVAASDATVLVHGESGTGKELVAHEIVRRSARSRGPLVTIDCSSISPTLIESELFGHARGAFTGADRVRVGAFEAAHRGTIFLDEIGEMPIEMQPKLLRALEAREIRRAGENEVRKVDVRVIAATNRNLEREVNRGTFREDLYFRLSVFMVRLPPLRERVDDIPELVSAFLERMGAGDAQRLFTPEVYRELKRHEWPGNVRELRNYVERAIVLQDVGSSPIASAARPPSEAGPAAPNHDPALATPFKIAKERLVAQFERTYLERLMATAGGNVSLASRMAKLDRMHLHRLLQRHSIGREAEARVGEPED
jgi:DNA-binding NtrC family response regulator